MFTLVSIADTIRIDPGHFGLPHEVGLANAINSKYSNYVLTGEGLCIALYDVQNASDGLLRPGDGAMYVKCTFRMIVFKPFVGEILVGWVSSCKEDGLSIKMDFFEQIHIPKHLLFEGCVFIPKEQAWCWKNDDFELFIDSNEKVRFRVEDVTFGKSMSIIGSCSMPGTGLLSWWKD